ncbi:hypothetical protein SAMN02787142_7822 [Burkholderia sp. WP9]|nr:hypothetical protein SAMN02787142_7822 [Burkholderia sp. WP9]
MTLPPRLTDDHVNGLFDAGRKPEDVVMPCEQCGAMPAVKVNLIGEESGCVPRAIATITPITGRSGPAEAGRPESDGGTRNRQCWDAPGLLLLPTAMMSSRRRFLFDPIVGRIIFSYGRGRCNG